MQWVNFLVGLEVRQPAAQSHLLMPSFCLLEIIVWALRCFSLNTWNNRKAVVQSVSTERCVHSMLLREGRIWHQNIWRVSEYTARWDGVEDCVGQREPNLAWSPLRNDLSSGRSISWIAPGFTLEGGNTLICFTTEPKPIVSPLHKEAFIWQCQHIGGILFHWSCRTSCASNASVLPAAL